jgi:hypothetical protein
MKRIPKKLRLGNNYIIWFDYKNKMVCKFIQPTRCGFNFLNLDSNKCILPHHLYPSKSENHKSGDWFWINKSMNIEDSPN